MERLVLIPGTPNCDDFLKALAEALDVDPLTEPPLLVNASAEPRSADNLADEPPVPSGHQDDRELSGICDHTYGLAREIMAGMGWVDVEATLSLFATYGADCDCEIVRRVR